MEFHASGEIPPESFLLIIGAMKCGTTSLFSYLASHPMICASNPKEPEFFSRKQAHQVDVTRYEELWNYDSSKHRYAMEASTGYTKFPRESGVAERICAFGLQPRFVYIIRDPIERIESHINYAMQRGRPLDKEDSIVQLVELCKYNLQLRQFTEFFGRERILVLDFRRLVEEPKALLTDVYRFLDVPDHTDALDLTPKNRTRLEPTLLRKLSGSPVAGLRNLVPAAARQRLKGAARQLLPAPKKQALSQSERTRIRNQLADDMAELHSNWGVDIRQWGF
ncbi:MAG: sulfotransferase [Pseudomonadota bacterium]